MSQESEMNSPKRAAGRPPRGEEPAFPREEVDRILVYGEIAPMPGSSEGVVQYPSYRELGKRYGVSHTLIAKFSQKKGCLERRMQVGKTDLPATENTLKRCRGNNFSLTEDDRVRIIDRFLLKFEDALEEGRVRCSSASDYIMMNRLRDDILGKSKSKQEMPEWLPTLEELQDEHAKVMRERAEITPETSCIVDSHVDYAHPLLDQHDDEEIPERDDKDVENIEI